MQVVEAYPDGVFSWVDLGTTDTEAAKAYYGGLFGWTFLDLPTDSGSVYSMAQIEGKHVAGLGPLGEEMQAQGVPPFWTAYINHSNVDAVAEKAAAAEGLVMAPPFDVMDSGRMAIIQDPSGAMFGVWQPAAHTGAQLVNRPNALVWTELQTPDVEKAKRFYEAVFGWTFATDENGYVACQQEGRVQAGMMQIDESWGDVPPNWSVYFLVADLDETMSKNGDLGGSVVVPPTPAGELGRFAVLQDPQGGVFSIIEYDAQPDPPPGH